MALSRLDARSVRNIERAHLEFGPHLNVVVGPNGSGKTSLLESIHLLGVGRSFRTRRIGQVIRKGEEELTVFGEFTVEGGRPIRLGVRKARNGESTIRIDGRNAESMAEVAWAVPMQAIVPGGQDLIEGGPALRRAFLDWGMFHVEPGFQEIWRNYMRALKQRNAALKSGARTEPWDPALSETGEAIVTGRDSYAGRLGSATTDVWHRLGQRGELGMDFHRGWPSGKDLRSALRDAGERDRRLGFTTVGAHRSEIGLKADGNAARDVMSRGQIKLLLIALRLAQVVDLHERTGKRAIVLLDDLAAELDSRNRAMVLEVLKEAGSQVIATATEAGLIEGGLWDSLRMFHVEHGIVTAA